MAYSSEDFELALAEALKQVAKAPSERKPLYTKTLPGGRAQYPYAFTITQPDLDKPRPGWGCTPESQKFPSAQLQSRHERIQVDE
ncbi:hypothetical protein, partial [Pseudomonas sp. DP16D-R1]|uniref:hypothetical protein n=1 Tax=Pseudomonas sp. DP16D-R1 TaxID=2075551 RepID=UPI001C464976